MSEKARKRILLIEDDRDGREVMADVLGERWEIAACSSAEEAFERLEKERFDAVITDIQLFGMTGFQVLERIRGSEGHAKLPVIFCSSLADAEARDRAIAMGASEFIAKPCKPEAIFRAVQSVLA